MNFLRNTWYVAAWAEELKTGALLPRRLLDEPVLLFRDSSGTARALSDRCPHRFAPLHLGTLNGDTVQCRYHGLTFNGQGECVHNPHGAIPRAARVPNYPVIERYSMLWIWMGDPAKADDTLIPDFSFQDPERAYTGKRYLHVHANFLLEVDNIMDLSHIQFLHPTTLGSGAVAGGVTQVSQDGNTVWSKRTTQSEIVSEFLCKAMNVPEGTLVDRWMDVRWDPPSTMALFSGGVRTGQARSEDSNTSQIHAFTPETEATTHYWFGFSMPKTRGEAAAEEVEKRSSWLKEPFETEDRLMLEAVQQNMGAADFWSLKPILLTVDAGGVRARRTFDRLLAEEQQAISTTHPAQED